jgi:PAS domain-containing protein
MPQNSSSDAEMIRALFDAIPSFVFAVDQDVRIIEYNTAAATLVGDNRELVLAQRSGEALQCLNATAGGCGQALHCRSCVIRSSVASAFEGGVVVRRRTKMELRSEGRSKEVYLMISASPFTYKEKPLVLLVLEDVSQVVELQFLIPVCSKCKKVRADKEYWTRLETYCREFLGAEFSHGYCPDCFDAEVAAMEKMKKK